MSKRAVHILIFFLGFVLVSPLVACGGMAAPRESNQTLEQRKQQLIDQASVDDQATEDIENEVALLNITRAALHRPRAFVDVASWAQGIPTSSAQFSASIGATPSIGGGESVQSATSTATLAPLTKQEFMRGSTTPISPDLIAYYAQQGYPVSMLLHVFVRQIRVFNAEGQLVTSYVNSPMMSDPYPAFDALINGLSSCYVHADTQNYFVDEGDSSVPPVEMPKTVDLKTVSDVLGKNYVLIPATSNPKKYVLMQQKDQLIFSTPASSTSASQCMAAKDYLAQIGVQGTHPPKPSAPSVASGKVTPDPYGRIAKNPHFDLVLRSPEAVVYYLGEVVREQMHGPYDTATWKPDAAHRSYIGALDFRTCKPGASDCIPRCEPLFVLFTNSLPPPSSGTCYRMGAAGPTPIPVTTTDVSAMNAEQKGSDLLSVTYTEQVFMMPWDTDENSDTATVFGLMEQIIGLQTNAAELPTTGVVKAVP